MKKLVSIFQHHLSYGAYTTITVSLLLCAIIIMQMRNHYVTKLASLYKIADSDEINRRFCGLVKSSCLIWVTFYDISSLPTYKAISLRLRDVYACSTYATHQHPPARGQFITATAFRLRNFFNSRRADSVQIAMGQLLVCAKSQPDRKTKKKDYVIISRFVRLQTIAV